MYKQHRHGHTAVGGTVVRMGLEVNAIKANATVAHVNRKVTFLLIKTVPNSKIFFSIPLYPKVRIKIMKCVNNVEYPQHLHPIQGACMHAFLLALMSRCPCPNWRNWFCITRLMEVGVRLEMYDVSSEDLLCDCC